jgi:hypothetical protein
VMKSTFAEVAKGFSIGVVYPRGNEYSIGRSASPDVFIHLLVDSALLPRERASTIRRLCMHSRGAKSLALSTHPVRQCC